jgi:acyl-CoA thioester hydrolase
MTHPPLSISARRTPLQVERYGIPAADPFLADLSIHQEDVAANVVGHVSNTEYVRWLDRVAELHSDAVGYTRQRLLDEGLMWFVARHEIDYLSEVWGGEELVIATWVRDMRRVRSWRDYVIIRPSDESVVCRAATLWVLVNLESRRPVQIPRSMVESFGCASPC